MKIVVIKSPKILSGILRVIFKIKNCLLYTSPSPRDCS